MAETARTGDRSRAALILALVAAVAAAPRTGRAAEDGGTGPATPADSVLLLAQATGTASSAVRGAPAASAPAGAPALDSGSGFTVRRVANPNYRSPLAGAIAPVRQLGALVGSQFARAQVTHRTTEAGFATTDWDVAAGGERGARRGFQVWAQGYTTPTYTQLRLLRLSALQGPLEWNVGDLPAQPIGTLPWIQRLRGASLLHLLPRGSDWRVLAGVVPTLVYGVTPNTALATAMLDAVPVEDGSFSVGLLGFGRVAPQKGGLAALDPDSLPGGGGAALTSARVAVPAGDFTATFMAQIHDLDGSLAPAGVQALEWGLRRPNVLFAARDQIGTGNARQPGSDRLIQAPSHEARLNAQVRMLEGRAEVHLAGLASSPTRASPEAQTAQAGISGNLGASGWYTGADYSWNRRAPLFDVEQRIALQTGHTGGRIVTLMRFERATYTYASDHMSFTGAASATAVAGLHAAIEPRLEWRADRFERSMCSARLGWPLFGPAARMNASVTVLNDRTRAFRGEVSEATLSLTFTPRSRDRAQMEARRYEDGGVRSFEYSAGYDMQSDVYSNPARVLADQRSGALVVTVARADSASGVADVLVSLDGREFRFTDGQGVARFTDPTPGTHVVSIAERSLPANQRVVGSATAFVTIERGRVPDPVRFEVARPVRKVKF